MHTKQPPNKVFGSFLLLTMAFFRRALLLCLLSGVAADQAASDSPKQFLAKGTDLAAKPKCAPEYVGNGCPDEAGEMVPPAGGNKYVPGENGPIFETPAPGDNRAQSYVDTGKTAVILGFFFMGIVIFITWMECKMFCATVHILG